MSPDRLPTSFLAGLRRHIDAPLCVLPVLHLHASDMCRFGVESKLYPALHTKMTAPAEHYYSQDDIKAMIKYGKTNGIRVVPEFVRLPPVSTRPPLAARKKRR